LFWGPGGGVIINKRFLIELLYEANNGTADRPTINLEEIREVNSIKFFSKKSTTDFTFYLEDEE